MLPFLIISAFFFCHSGDDLIFDTVFSFCSIPIKYFHQNIFIILFDIGYYGFIARNYSSFFELITLDALPVSGGGLLVFVIAKLVILAVPDGIRQVLLVHPMVAKSCAY